MAEDTAYEREMTELHILANYGHPMAALLLKRLDQARDQVAAILFGPRSDSALKGLIDG